MDFVWLCSFSRSKGGAREFTFFSESMGFDFDYLYWIIGFSMDSLVGIPLADREKPDEFSEGDRLVGSSLGSIEPLVTLYHRPMDPKSGLLDSPKFVRKLLCWLTSMDFSSLDFEMGEESENKMAPGMFHCFFVLGVRKIFPFLRVSLPCDTGALLVAISSQAIFYSYLLTLLAARVQLRPVY